MKPTDYAKALALAVLVLALNLALLVLIVFVYGHLIEPGRERAFYDAAALSFGRWSGPIGGAVLFLAAGWLAARRRPRRNGLAFIAVTWLLYALVDGALAVPMGGLSQVLTPPMAVSMAAALAAGLAGAALGARARRQGFAVG